MPYQNWEILVSIAFYFGAKIFCFTIKMFRQDALSSIPERNEIEEAHVKWVPKKKHEVLKAKYKCLKKLFQIYDATMTGTIPEPSMEYPDNNTKRRLKRSHRTKTDACAGTTEIIFNGDTPDECECLSLAKSQHLCLDKKHSFSTQVETSKTEDVSESHASKSEMTSTSDTNSVFSTNSKENLSVNCHQIPPNFPQHIVPYLMNGRRKLTRFQSFVHRIFGIRQDAFISTNDVYAASDSYQDRRRRRGLRFRRLRRPKKIKSESDLKDMKSSAIMSYVQSVQKSCLMDTTPRPCPILGCKTIFYGIINYNDHLNLCHFKDRKFICHYCHEGFDNEYDKFIHENEHIGLNKLNALVRQKVASNSNTQTELEIIPEEKLKKIVSFFDKITSEEEGKRSSECNLTKGSNIFTETQDNSEKRSTSCINIRKCESSNSHTAMTSQQYGPSITCHVGQNLPYRRQLSLHEDLERRNKFSKLNHSCGALSHHRNIYQRPSEDRSRLVSEDGRLNVRSVDSHSIAETEYIAITPSISEVKLTKGQSNESLVCDPSTNIIYCTSMESMKKMSAVESLVKKFRSYKWEPGTKVIRV